MDTLQLRDNHTDILAALGHLHAGDVLDTHRVGHGVGVRTDAAHALHQNVGLDEVALLGQLLNAAVVITNKHLGIGDLFAVYGETSVDRLFQRGMVRSDRNGITHC